MLPFLRKHTGVVMFVLAFVFLGLAFFGDNMSLSDPGSGQVVMTTKNSSYSEQDLNKLAILSSWVASGYRSLGPFYTALLSAPGVPPSAASFLANRIILREEAEKMGLIPSAAQIDAEIKSMEEFQENGVFNPELYAKSMRRLNNRSFTEENFRELIKDKLSLDCLMTLIMAGVSVDESFSADQYDSLFKDITVKTATLNLDQFFNKDEQVDDATLKAYWEPLKNKYMSEEERSAIVYSFSPKNKDEAKEGDPAIPLATQKVGQVTEGIWEEVVNKRKGADLEIVVKENTANQGEVLTCDVQTFENFKKSDLPELLKKEFNAAAGQEGNLADVIYSVAPNGQAADNVSNVLIMNDGSVVIFQLTNIVESKPLDFEQAKEAARLDYIQEQSIKKLNEAADKLQKDLATGVSEGKSFDEIATAEKATVATIEDMSQKKIFGGSFDQFGTFFAARIINVGQVTPVIDQGTSRIIAQVTKSTIIDSPEVAGERTQFIKQKNQEAGILTFQDWFHNQFRDKQIKFTEAMQRNLSNK